MLLGRPEPALLVVCPACCESSAPAEVEVCDDCLQTIMGSAGPCAAIGTAEVPVRVRRFTSTIDESSLPPELDGATAVAPTGSGWVALVGPRVAVIQGAARRDLGIVDIPPDPALVRVEGKYSPTTGLVVSPDDRYVAVVQNGGMVGVVVDLETGRTTMTLARDGYHPNQTPFPVAFIGIDGRTLIVHATAWNRLDVSDPSNGQQLTPGEPGEPGYFHGQLTTGPDGSTVLDAGWIWGPMGLAVAWPAPALLGDQSGVTPTGRTRLDASDDWIVPMAWIDDDNVVIAGLGGASELQRLGVRLCNVRSGRRRWLPGPAADWLFGADGLLFSIEQAGLRVFDANAGVLVHEIPGFRPNHHRSGTAELLEIRGTALRSWRYGEPSALTKRPIF